MDMTYRLVITISALMVSSIENKLNLISDTFSPLQWLQWHQKSVGETDEFPKQKSGFSHQLLGWCLEFLLVHLQQKKSQDRSSEMFCH